MKSCTSRSFLLFVVLRGIAAANIEIAKTDVAAVTIHNLFEFDGEFSSRMDFAKLTSSKVKDLLLMQVLLLDEVSMLDTDCFDGTVQQHISIARFNLSLKLILEFILICWSRQDHECAVDH